MYTRRTVTVAVEVGLHIIETGLFEQPAWVLFTAIFFNPNAELSWEWWITTGGDSQQARVAIQILQHYFIHQTANAGEVEALVLSTILRNCFHEPVEQCRHVELSR